MTYVLGPPGGLGAASPSPGGPDVLNPELGGGQLLDRCAILRYERSPSSLGFGVEETLQQFAADAPCKFLATGTLRESPVAGTLEAQAVIVVQFGYASDVRPGDILKAEVVNGENLELLGVAVYCRVLGSDRPHSEGALQNVKCVRVFDFSPV